MKVVALISGGKDSCYNMIQCVAAGHTIVALANLRPANTDEMDSYMYQTVGHQAIDLYAEAMGLPLYRRTIEGCSLNIEREYSQKDGDEVEDLYQLLKLVKEKESVEAVSVGAILSDYQRVRVEHVCSRLQLQPLAYLWRREQAALLREMISSGLHALLIKVAALGLDPGTHLGKPLAEMESYLQELSEKYGVHVCGEGGEYETFTTDCPLFNRRIVIDAMETVVHSADAFAPVGYLRFTKMHTEDKGSAHTLLPRGGCPCLRNADELTAEVPCADRTCDHHLRPELASVGDLICERVLPETECQPRSSGRSRGGYEWITGIGGDSSECADVQGQTQQALALLQGELQKSGWQLKHVVLVHLYVKDMEDFSEVNSVYGSLFRHRPPARVCIQARLPAGQLLRMDVLLHDWALPPEEGCFQQRDTLHVRSLSHWAPASIGPYSQAVRVDEAVFCAGQIALVPCTMQLLHGGPTRQAQLCYGHMSRVMGAVGPGLHLHHALQAHCYVTHSAYIPAVRRVWQRRLLDEHRQVSCSSVEKVLSTPLEVAVVPSLPRGADVELHVIAVRDEPAGRTSCQRTSEVLGNAIQWQVLQASSGQYASLSLSVTPAASGPACTQAVLQALGTSLQQALGQTEKALSPLCARVFYKDSSELATGLCAGLEGCLESVLGVSRPALVQVPVLELPDCSLLHISCWLSI
ncbi:diphthine--ammonia ligase isoform X2 [Electrophorus electricus]|uniref:diphthine--ammonia ligase isoform X2 n=1 Tax=Electrophorus electricus TaxID=8005 RepID=UPI0015CFA844|nr:diphthine--ammonia ligase isoform X2 [Electrophorus electricus]